ncbi:MAG: hypothetical protein OZ921_08800 [Sorangiineae bacterium]|nr:hypothetical protein [Polyangiaceae bacterium]MEB2322599.1 hypothetical protein [Sorangiineae bacterium]
MSVLRVTLVFALSALSGCGGNTTSGGGAGGTSGAAGTGSTSGGGGSGGGGARACTTDQDCPDHGVCGYPSAAACVAKGTCFPAPGAVCEAFSPGCACDGSTINMICTGLPEGYVSSPLAYAGPCEDADAGCTSGSCLSTTPCTWDTDCAALGSTCDPCAKRCGCASTASTFACGSELSCDSATQYCSIASGGPCCNPPRYSCEPVPAACKNDVTCGCIEAEVGAQECSDSGRGVTVHFLYP